MMMMEGGEEKQRTNVNFLLEEYGIMVNTGERGGEGRGREGYAVVVSMLEGTPTIAAKLVV